MLNISDELTELDGINHCGFALLQYAVTLIENGSFIHKNGKWICKENFVTFQVHHKKTNNIRVSLRGYPTEYQEYSELLLKQGMKGYSEFVFEDTTQLFAASSYIRRALQLYKKGSRREHSRPITIGE